MVRKAEVLVHGKLAGYLVEENRDYYLFYYLENYQGPPISLTMPISKRRYEFSSFPAFFDGLLPEGPMLEGLLKKAKIDRDDYFSQLVHVGGDLVGAITVQEYK